MKKEKSQMDGQTDISETDRVTGREGIRKGGKRETERGMEGRKEERE